MKQNGISVREWRAQRLKHLMAVAQAIELADKLERQEEERRKAERLALWQGREMKPRVCVELKLWFPNATIAARAVQRSRTAIVEGRAGGYTWRMAKRLDEEPGVRRWMGEPIFPKTPPYRPRLACRDGRLAKRRQTYRMARRKYVAAMRGGN